MLPEEAIKRYQAVYKEVFGADITFAEAREKATSLYNFMKLLYRPFRKSDYDAATEKWEQIMKKLRAQKALDDDIKNH